MRLDVFQAWRKVCAFEAMSLWFNLVQVAHGIGGKLFVDGCDENARQLRELAKRLVSSGKIGLELQYVHSPHPASLTLAALEYCHPGSASLLAVS